MELTILGYILLPISLLFLIWRPLYLFYLAVFFIPFSASAVLNFDSVSFGLQPSQYFGILWMTSGFTSLLVRPKLTIPKEVKASLALILLFGFFVGASLLMPAIISGNVEAPGSQGYPGTAPVEFSAFNFTQFLYIAYGILLSASTAIWVRDNQTVVTAARVYVLSGLFVAAWAVLQYFCYYAGISYSSVLFNNSASSHALGYNQELSVFGLKRLTSVAVEPSALASYLLTCVALVSVMLIRKHTLFRWRLIEAATLVFFVMVLLLSTSTTAYVGLMLLLALLLFLNLRTPRAWPKLALWLGCLLLMVLALVTAFPNFLDALTVLTKGKLQTFSGQERLAVTLEAFKLFEQFPILGVGWGSTTAYSLIVKLLSNTGLLGSSVFFAFIVSILRTVLKASNVEPQALQNALLVSFATALCLTLLVDTLIGFSFVFAHFWFLTGCCLSLSGAVCRAHYRTIEIGHSRTDPEGKLS
ncbi:O-antigen ligase family protein [Desulforudis sp. DRI-14]|uniref:O-antigen ligase family protein n=1 Tax=Desulforudis sp. DRI-14 TaxID=3459793 RepID=UPI0040438DCA